jgi:predicted amidohydrolase YtcJ
VARGRSPLNRRRSQAEPDLILYGATLLDVSRAGRVPRGKEAVWIRNGRIAAVASLAEVKRRAGRGAEVVDLGGGTLTPGFTDSHIHLITWIRAIEEPWLQAQDVASIEAAAARRLEAAPDEEWILVRGWLPREWPLERRSRDTLDRIAGGRPLVLHAVDGHSVWGNAEAFERAGIDAKTPNPPGGEIQLGRDGKPTGALIEEAYRLLTSRITRRASPRDELARAFDRARSLGITSAHDFDRSATWRAAAELARSGPFDFRLLLSVPVASLDAATTLGLAAGLGGDRLRVGPVKMFADGTLGSSTALLEEPYAAGGTGVEVMSPVDLQQGCAAAARSGLSVAIHAIGDRAVRNALDAIERTRADGGSFPLPPRIEHIQLSRSEDWPRFQSLGVLASVQPIHQVSDRSLARKLWNDRTTRSYAWKSLERAGAKLIFGSDAPFDRAGPLLAIQAALLRREAGEPPGETFHPEQRVTLRRALRAHLEDPHLAAGWAVRLGKIFEGFGADLVHFSHDLHQTPCGEWARARVLAVWVGGRRVPVRAGDR